MEDMALKIKAQNELTKIWSKIKLTENDMKRIEELGQIIGNTYLCSRNTEKRKSVITIKKKL